jgi:hypothetical protein
MKHRYNITARQAAKTENQKAKREKSKGKNLCAGPRAGLGRNLQGLAAIKTIVHDSIVNDSILERCRKLAASRNLRGAQRNGTLVVQSASSGARRFSFKEERRGQGNVDRFHGGGSSGLRPRPAL